MNQTISNRAGQLARIGLFLYLALALGNGMASGVRLLGIRTAPRGEGVRVVLDLEGRATCRLEQAKDGTWSVLLKKLCPAVAPKPILRPHALLTTIEARCAGEDLRIELNGAKALTATGFRIAAEKTKPERFVIDLLPERGASAAPTPEPEEPSAEAPALGGSIPPVPAASANPEPLPRRSGKWRILIDPGHGGNDPGASRRGLQEKEIVLDVARRVARMLNGTDGFEARLSRNDDRLVPLRQRFAAAEKFNADAFVSIHVNASGTRKAYGVEVFFLSLGGASDEASRDLAKLENQADPDYVVEEDSLLQGIPFSFDLRQSDTIVRSSRLAESVLDSFEKTGLAASRGVKQAGFAVLKSFQVPSILVETGFISNPEEARRLKDPQHRERLAACIAQGTTAFFEKFARARTETSGER
jgi:N-acetylmuramoyl-L-alanine amidase